MPLCPFPGCPFAPLPLSRSSLADSGQPLRGAACHGRHQVWVQFPGLRPAARQVVRQDWVTTIALEHECPLNRSMNKPPSTHVLRTLQPVKEQPQLAPHNQHIFFTGRWVPVPYHRVVVPYSPTMVSVRAPAHLKEPPSGLSKPLQLQTQGLAIPSLPSAASMNARMARGFG